MSDYFYKQLKVRQNDIYKSVCDENVMVSVQIQSLIELLCEHFLFENEGYDNSELRKSAFDLMSSINDGYIRDSKLFREFVEVNTTANNIKHGDYIARFDRDLIRKFFYIYNKIVEKLYHKDTLICEEIKLDENIFNRDLKIKTEFDKRLNEKVLSTIQNSLKPSTKNNDDRVVKWFTRISVSICCGYGKQDKGFEIWGLRSYSDGAVLPCSFNNASIYATIYNFLQRSSNIEKSGFIQQYESISRKSVNYKNIYRYQMILLNLIRFNYFSNDIINIRLLDGSEEELKLAFQDIINYAKILADLAGIDFKQPVLDVNSSGTTITLTNMNTNNKVIYPIDFSEIQSSKRDIWNQENIKYRINSNHKSQLEVLLKDFFKFNSFKDGQFEALKSMLNSEGNSICLLPTGGGKSLIYYFMGLLNPNPIIIVSPTSILIHDQIRNMKYFHNIDDVYRIDPVFNYSITPNKFIFITPETLQHYYIISKIINWNVNSKVSYVVLDEVHTICNWSHDFRPAYLMLSHNLMSFIDNTSILSFTATANYKVLSDLIAQINIKKDNIFSPVELKKENIIFEFYPVANEEECCSAVGKELENFVYEQTNEKAIVFSKNTGFTNSIIDSLSEASKYEISTYDSQNIYSYEEFVKGYTKVLLADIDLGVGLNLPKVSMTVHNGTPISKAQYVQEIGRAGREGDTCKSKVFFKSKEYLSDDELKLINYNTSIDELIYLIRKLSNINEIASTFKRMFGHIENQAKSSQNIMDIYTQINGVERYTSLEFTYDNSEAYEEISRLQKYLYVLFRIGVIHNWFIIEKSLEKNTIKFFIEVTEEKDNLNYIKHKISEYLNSIGKYKEKIYEIKNAKAISDIIFLYVEWYYEEFIYHHKEQLLNMINFLQSATEHKNDEIVNDLKDYFYLPIIDIEFQINSIKNLKVSQIIGLFEDGLPDYNEAAIQKGIESNYDVKLDLYLLLTDLFKRRNFELSRFIRIVNKLNYSDKLCLKEKTHVFYSLCNVKSRITILNTLFQNEISIDLINQLYQKCDKDIIYYGYLSIVINRGLSYGG